jgi:hypothetical protein
MGTGRAIWTGGLTIRTGKIRNQREPCATAVPNFVRNSLRRHF